MQKAADYFLESCIDEGIACDESIAERIMKMYKCPTLQDALNLMTYSVDDPAGLYTTRKLLRGEVDLFQTLDFFIGRDKYTAADRTRILDETLVDPSIAQEAKEMATALSLL